MSTPQLLLLNIGAAALLTLILTTLMLLPRYLREHHHPHLEGRVAQPRWTMAAARPRPRNPRPPAAGRVVTGP